MSAFNVPSMCWNVYSCYMIAHTHTHTYSYISHTYAYICFINKHTNLIFQSREQQTFSVKGYKINILSFVGHTGTVASTQVSSYCSKVATGENGHGCVIIKLYLQKEEVSWIWSMRYSLLTLAIILRERTYSFYWFRGEETEAES